MRRFSNSPPDWVFPDRVAADQAINAEPISSESAVISDSPLESEGPKVVLRCLADVVTKPLEWVFEDVIPRGEVTVLAGDAGVGKSRFYRAGAPRLVAQSAHAARDMQLIDSPEK